MWLASAPGMKRFDLRVSDLMTTSLTTVNATDPITGAHAEMEVSVIRHLPVVDDRMRLVGVLSDRDVLRSHGTKKRVADIMTRDVITVRPDAPAYSAAEIMLDNKISSVLVVDETSTLVGMVTQTDYLDLARRALLGLPLER
jgi:CBS domain-containing membrane protein